MKSGQREVAVGAQQSPRQMMTRYMKQAAGREHGKGNNWEPGRIVGRDRKGQKDMNNWGEEEKRETTDSTGSWVHTLLPISLWLSSGPLLESSLNVRTLSYHMTVPPLQGLPFPVGPPIQRTLGSLPNHKGVFRPPLNHSRLLCRPLKPHQGPQRAPNHTKVI